MKTFFILLTFFWLAACDSPMNHRVQEDTPQTTLKAKEFSNFTLTVEPRWIAGPTGSLSVESQLLVILKDKNGSPVELPPDLSLSFYATMPSMGHPLDDPGYFESLGQGLYVNRHIRFNMEGDWLNELWIMDQDLNIKDKVVWKEFF